MSTLAERLTMAMKHANVTQAELARACGVKPPSVSGWLSGKAKFLRGENLLRAAAALSVSQSWLATGKGEMAPSSKTVIFAPNESQTERYNREKMELAATFTQDWFEREGLEFYPRTDWDIVLGAYDLLSSGEESNVVHLDTWLNEQAARRGWRHVRQRKAGSSSKTNLGKDLRKKEGATSSKAGK